MRRPATPLHACTKPLRQPQRPCQRSWEMHATELVCDIAWQPRAKQHVGSGEKAELRDLQWHVALAGLHRQRTFECFIRSMRCALVWV